MYTYKSMVDDDTSRADQFHNRCCKWKCVWIMQQNAVIVNELLPASNGTEKTYDSGSVP
jgi:hypothetical protein